MELNNLGTWFPAGTHRAVIAGLIFALVCATVTGVVAVLLAGSSTTGVIAATAISFYGALIAAVYVQGVRSGVVSLDTLGLARAHLGTGIAHGAVAGVAVLLVSALNGAVMSALGVEHPQTESMRWLLDLPGWQLLVGAATVAVAAPIAEELFFRGWVFHAYLAGKGDVTAYVASALMFALVHGLPALFPAIFGMGLILAYAYRRSGTIIAPAFAHVANNSLAFVAALVLP